MSYNSYETGCPNQQALDTEEYHKNMAAHQVRLSEDRQIRAVRACGARDGDRALEYRCWDALAGCEEARASLLEML
jgi:hypothetical protein